MFGSDIGSSSSVVRILGSDGGAAFGDLSALQLGQIASSSLFGAMVASAALIFVGDKNIGRKMELQVQKDLLPFIPVQNSNHMSSLIPYLPSIYIFFFCILTLTTHIGCFCTFSHWDFGPIFGTIIAN